MHRSITLALAMLFCLLSPTRGEEDPIPVKLFSVRGGLGNVLGKLQGDGAVRIAYFGGSITAQNGWRPKTLAWFRKTWPGVTIAEINAAIGGTGSDLGVYRCQQDVLQHKPDLVFVEFAVNDGGAAPERIYRSMEGIVRQTWRANPETDICFIYTFHTGHVKAYREGNFNRSAAAMERLADHYAIPSITVALPIVQLEAAGKLIFTVPRGTKGPERKIVFSHDACHPTDGGHEVYTETIIKAFADIQKVSRAGKHTLGKPYRDDNWEDAKLVPLDPSMLTGSWKKLPTDDGLGKRFRNRLPTIWHGGKPGDKITFRFKGNTVKLYDLLGPDGGKAICSVDGKVVRTSPRFDRYCSYH
ncbi:SGNH/GDSL hydrolase family protein, partial [bacterium]|nr:SGNH/GDSL hydrolase family protein [bacterium]